MGEVTEHREVDSLALLSPHTSEDEGEVPGETEKSVHVVSPYPLSNEEEEEAQEEDPQDPFQEEGGERREVFRGRKLSEVPRRSPLVVKKSHTADMYTGERKRKRH